MFVWPLEFVGFQDNLAAKQLQVAEDYASHNWHNIISVYDEVTFTLSKWYQIPFPWERANYSLSRVTWSPYLLQWPECSNRARPLPWVSHAQTTASVSGASARHGNSQIRQDIEDLWLELPYLLFPLKDLLRRSNLIRSIVLGNFPHTLFSWYMSDISSEHCYLHS